MAASSRVTGTPICRHLHQENGERDYFGSWVDAVYRTKHVNEPLTIGITSGSPYESRRLRVTPQQNSPLARPKHFTTVVQIKAFRVLSRG